MKPTIVALRDVICRALDAVDDHASGCMVVGWDLAFVNMSRVEQADWLIELFCQLKDVDVETVLSMLPGEPDG